MTRFGLLILIVLAGCSLFRSTSESTAGEVQIAVDNQNFYDATVYVRWQAGRQRLGTVSGHTERAFTTPWRGPQLQVEIDLLAGGTRTGDRVSVGPDDIVAVEILPQDGRVRTCIR